ncbi:MAG: BlaI/MecI/CopY family transcriptional regulator [Oscillospiraceae bacterium]
MSTENKISPSEQDIMLYVWRQNRSVALKEVVMYFSGKKAWAKSTTHTLLTRLCSKEYLRCDKQAGTNIYTALITQRQYVCQYSTQVISSVFAGSMKKFLYAYYNVNKPTTQELDEISDLISSLRGQ